MANNINEINVSLVLQKLWLSGGISRTDISRQVKLGKSTVTKIVADLMHRHLVTVAEKGRSGPSGGRTPLRLTINGDYGCVLGVEMQTDFCKAVVINLRGEVIFSHSQPIEFRDRGAAATFLEFMKNLQEKVMHIRLPLIGIGVGLAGIVNAAEGVIVQSNPLDIRAPLPFRAAVAERVGVPVLIENDANCCCWGELAFRKTERHRNFCFVLGEFRKGRTTGSEYWGIAVGLGFVLDGKVYCGEDFSAGEFQSILWQPTNHGQFSVGDDESRRITSDPGLLEGVFRELASHAAFLVNILNLKCVIIGGEIAVYREELTSILKEEIQRNWSYQNTVDCSIEFAALGDMAVAYGAAGMFLEHFFSIPEVEDSLTPRKVARLKVPAKGGQKVTATAWLRRG
jgi:predicted NBD/HSP70 family sugar kinase